MQAWRFSSYGQHWRLGLLLGLMFGLFGGRPAWAQSSMRRRAFSPSQSSPSQQLERNFGRVGDRSAPQAFTFNRSANSVASISNGLTSSGSRGVRRRSSQMRGASSGMLGSRMLGRYSGYGMQPQATGFYRPYHRRPFLSQVEQATFQGVARYGNFYPYQQKLSRISTRYANWGAPELVAKRSDRNTQLSKSKQDEDISIPTPKVTLQERVKNNLSSRCRLYEVRAMEAFKAGDYQEACIQLTMAGATAVDEPDKQMYFKLVFIYASISAEQYAEALNALRWIFDEDPTTGGLRNPQVLNQVRDVSSFYGRQEDYTARQQQFTSYIEQQPKSPDAMALRAIMAWGKGDVANATFYARQLADLSDTDSRWPRLYEMVQQAQQGNRAGLTEEVRESVRAEPPPLVEAGEAASKVGEDAP